MTTQQIVAFGIGALALGYLLWRNLRRRASGNCCGEKQCPASGNIVDKIKSHSGS